MQIFKCGQIAPGMFRALAKPHGKVYPALFVHVCNVRSGGSGGWNIALAATRKGRSGGTGEESPPAVAVGDGFGPCRAPPEI